MKKFNMLLIVGLLIVGLFTGCISGQVQINQESQDAIAKITGRRVGYELAIQYPDVAKEINVICQEIVIQDEPDFIKIAITRLAIILTAEFEDPLLAADIQDILALVKIETDIEITSGQIQTIKAAAVGLISGTKIGSEL